MRGDPGGYAGIAAPCLGFPIAAYLEPHIEQGPQLEASARQIGVVTGIQGARWYVVEVDGEPGHAGTALRGRATRCAPRSRSSARCRS